MLTSIDGLAAGTIASGEVTTLAHELGNHSMKLAVLVAEALLTSAKSTEVLSSLGDGVGVQLKGNATLRLASNVEVEEHLGVLAGHSASGRSHASAREGGAEGKSRASKHDEQDDYGLDKHQLLNALLRTCNVSG
jgi:hypothetical protein